MTVGIAAACGEDSGTPRVIVAADRLVTTHQQSAIEHEHPEAKIEPLGEGIPGFQALGVVAGSVGLGEELTNMIEEYVPQFLASNDTPDQVDMATVAQIGGECYRNLVQDKIHHRILSKYGFELDDLKTQHQFKDDFFESLMGEIHQYQQVIYQNLILVIGGVDESGSFIYQISRGEISGHNKMGYATIGSGKQPAESEFIQAEHGSGEPFETCVATTIAAVARARQASGVGEKMDLGVVGGGYAEIADESVVKDLMKRQDVIREKQTEAKREVLRGDSLDWRPGT